MKLDLVIDLVTNSLTVVFSFATDPEDLVQFMQEVYDLVSTGGFEIWIEPEEDYFDRLDESDFVAKLFEDPKVAEICDDKGYVPYDKRAELEQYLIDSRFGGDRKAYFRWILAQPEIQDAIESWEFPLTTHFVVKRLDGTIDHELFAFGRLYSVWGTYNG